eukprot:1117912-Prorocentrum_minimum.AAC.2
MRGFAGEPPERGHENCDARGPREELRSAQRLHPLARRLAHHQAAARAHRAVRALFLEDQRHPRGQPGSSCANNGKGALNTPVVPRLSFARISKLSR